MQTFSITLDLPNATAGLQIPESYINPVVAGFWPADRYLLDPIEISTGDTFEFRFALPSSIGGIATQPGQIGDNYILFERKDGQAGFRVRNDLDPLIGNMGLRFAATSETVTASLSGMVRIPVSNTELGAVSLNYDSSNTTWPFETRIEFPNGPFRISFGPVGNRLCALDCTDTNNPENCVVEICF